MKSNLSLVAGAAIFLISTSSSALTPWSIIPITATTFTVPPGVTATVQYTVTNNSVTHTLMMVPIAGISQITTGAGICSNPFTLTKGASCILSLQVNGSALTTNINSGPQVCQQGADGQPSPQLCYQPASQSASLNITASTTALALGDSFGGGTVACLGEAPYLNLIAATDDNSDGIQWGGIGINVLDAESPADGATNTANIVARLTPSIQASNTYAAGLCSDYTGGGYTDWFLPAQDQLNCLYQTQLTVPLRFSATSYWSSTEVNAVGARSQDFSNGIRINVNKFSTFRVRCVRALSL